MPGSLTLVRIVQSTLATLAMLTLLAATAATAQATNGTIRAIKGGDRKAGETSNRAYALPVAGARFEYTSSETKAKDPASTGWTAFPSLTDAIGVATVSVQAGTYYVREQAVPGGFSNFGPVKSLFYDPSSGLPAAARPYVAKVVVNHNQVTEAYPNHSASNDTGDWSSTSGGDKGSPFVNVRDNQAFPGSCGINILMVLDRSGSIGPFKSAYRDAARAFVNALDGTPTQIGILSFSAGDSGVSSYQDGSGSSSLTHAPLDLGVAGSAATLKSTIDNVYASPSGGTNWDRALQKASQAKGFASNAATGQTTNPDVVVFITDGNPTARSTDGSDSGSDVDLLDLTAGMASANLVKSQPARALTKLKLYALGVGSGVTPDNLKAVSGPVLGEDYETPTVAELTAKLTELAARTCGARVFVRKRLAGNAADQSDWGFSAATDGGSISYLDGNRRTHATTGNGVETGVILTPLPPGGREVTVTEDAAGQPLSDFSLDSVSCRNGSYYGAPVVPAANLALGVKLSVQRGAAIYCTFTNSPSAPRLTVSKTPNDQTIDAGQDAEFTIVVGNSGDGVARNATLSDQLPAPGVGGWVVSQQPSQGSCSVSGANLLTCTGLGDLAKGQTRTIKVKTGTSNAACGVYLNPAATASATNAPSASDGGKITCRKDAKITVVKDLVPASDSGRFDLKVGAGVVAANAGDGGHGSAFVDPGTYAVSEAGAGATDLAGYEKSIACIKNGQPGPSGSGASLNVTVGYDDVVVCTITNTRLGTIEIEKQTDPDETGETTFGFTSSLDPQSSFELIDDGVETIGNVKPNAGGPAYEVTEATKPGYRLSAIDCGQDADSSGSLESRTARIHVSPGETVHCTFTNAKLNADIEIDKRVDREVAHVGDTLAYRFDVTNEGDTRLVVEFGDPRCDAGTLTGPVGDVDGDGWLDVGEAWVYRCSHVVSGGDPDPLPNTATVIGTDELGGKDADEDSTSVRVLRPAALVVKEGDVFAYPGDTVTFMFTVTNGGNAPLDDVVVSDDRCAPVTRTSGDESLEPGETWSFTCSSQIPATHRVGDENPIRNVATVTGKDPLGQTVTDDDDHLVRVLHPAVAIDKTGPASALLGTALAYALTVTNPGDVPFAGERVVVSDPRCEAPPAGPNTGADQTPAQLDPGDTWSYTCTAQTAGRPAGTFVNTATVTASDFNGRAVGDADEFATVLEAQRVLAGPTVVNGSARLRGPSGCVDRPFRATVRGSRIASVTFYRDGKRIKRITAKPGQRNFSVKVTPAAKHGVHRVTAKIRFKAASQTKTRTLRLSYQRCHKQIIQPRFTG